MSRRHQQCCRYPMNHRKPIAQIQRGVFVERVLNWRQHIRHHCSLILGRPVWGVFVGVVSVLIAVA